MSFGGSIFRIFFDDDDDDDDDEDDRAALWPGPQLLPIKPPL